VSPTLPSPTLVGRERELAVLHEHLDAALAGRGSLVLIGGEAGIGKTALAEALCREATERGALVLVGRCYDLSETPPYGPWVELFGRDTPTDAPLRLSTIFAEHGAAGAADSPSVLSQAVQGALAALAGRTPLILVLDDLHWADPASVDLLRVVARGLAAVPVLLLATYRADEVARGHPLYASLPALVRESRAERLDLRPLAEGDIREMIRRRYTLPPADEERLGDYLRTRAEGNPFYTGELLRSLADAGMLAPDGGDWALGDLTDATVPSLLRQVIDARVDHAGEEVRALLSAAAVIGQDIPFDLWRAVAEAEEPQLVDALARGMEAHLLAETADGRGVRFAHALVREALYAGIPPLRRRALHRRAGEALLADPRPDPDAVAYHLRQAGDPRAAAWLIRAGDRAREANALISAAKRYATALELLEEAGAGAGERAWLAFQLARVRWLADPDRALRHLDAAAPLAETAGDRALQAGVRYQRGFLLCMQGEMRRGIAEIEAAVQAIAALPGPDRAHLTERGWGARSERPDIVEILPEWLAWTGRFDDALAAAESIVRDAPEARAAPAGSHQAYANIYLGVAVAHAGKGEPDEARRAWAAARSINQTIDHAHQIGMNAFQELNWAALLYRADRPTERRALADEAEAAWRRAGGARPDVVPEAAGLLPMLVEGQWDEARLIATRAHAARSSGWARAVPNRVLAEIARARGLTDEAWAHATELLPDGPNTAPGDTWLLDTLPLLRLAALIAIDRGDLPAAGAWLAAHDRWLGWSGAVLGRSDGRALWARYHRHAGDLSRAREHADRALAYATEPRQPLALIAAHRLLGELDTEAGQHPAAAAHLDAALTLADACAAPYERALTLLAAAGLRAATGDGAGAHAALADARTTLSPLDAIPALARANALAARLAAPTAPPSHPAGLTAREIDVLRHLAAGRTNREIADALFLSPATVNIHVTHILAKTDSANRTEAAAFAHRHGLA